MCVIAIIRKKNPSLATLKAMASSNRDGIGLAFPKGGQVHFIKGITVDKAHDLIGKLPKPLVIHFRLATQGKPSAGLCHPFPIEDAVGLRPVGVAPSVLFHNGNISGWQDRVLAACALAGIKVPEGDWSDSRGVALLCSVYGPNALNLLGYADSAGYGNRFAVLFGNGSVKTWGQWHEYEGMQVSNTYFAPSKAWHEGGREFVAPGSKVMKASKERSSARWSAGGDSEVNPDLLGIDLVGTDDLDDLWPCRVATEPYKAPVTIHRAGGVDRLPF